MNNRELTMKLFRVQGLLMRGGPRGRHGNAHRGQGRLLSLLRLKPETSQKELSYVLDMRQQSLSELLGKLESKGYITRATSQEDKRVTLVSLTEAGRAAAPDADVQEESGPFDCLTEEECQNLADYLDRVAQALEDELGEERREWGDRPWPPQPPFGFPGGPCGHHGPGPAFGGPDGPCGHHGHGEGHCHHHHGQHDAPETPDQR